MKKLYVIIIFVLALSGCDKKHACEKNPNLMDSIPNIKVLYHVSLSDAQRKLEQSSDFPVAQRDNWHKFKSNILENDCLYYFMTNDESWRKLQGREGYFIVRNGKIIDAYLQLVN